MCKFSGSMWRICYDITAGCKHQGHIQFDESGFRFIVNPDLDSLANWMVWICGCCRKWRHCYSFTFVILMSLLVSLVNPRQNWIRWIHESEFAHWMDGFTESGQIRPKCYSSSDLDLELLHIHDTLAHSLTTSLHVLSWCCHVFHAAEFHLPRVVCNRTYPCLVQCFFVNDDENENFRWWQ